MKTKPNIVIGFLISLIILSACGNSSGAILSPTPYFPQLKDEPNGYPAELLTGELVLVDGCLRLKDSEDTSRLLIWPHDYSVNVESDVIQIIDGTGQAVAQVGDKLKVGGGSEFAQSLLPAFPDNCPGPYFIVGVVVGKVDEE